ncbi:MAG: ABC transporter ATP-binding protein [Spirochaetia bacterium]|nr:ABC transporter ATP-binding protein [Spirochaetia bacterium]
MSIEYLKFQNLQKQFAYHRAVKSATGCICEGDYISLFGINGAGKSTLLYLLAGIYKPDKGAIEYGVQGKKNFHALMHLLSHQSMFYARLTAEQNLVFFQGLYGNVDTREILFALELTGLSAHRSKFIDGFSRGMIQRLMIARMILAKPEFVFFDEPFTGLDMSGQRLLLSIIKNRGMENPHWKIKGYIFVDHDIVRAYNFSSSIWYIHKGELQKPYLRSELSIDKLGKMLT